MTKLTLCYPDLCQSGRITASLAEWSGRTRSAADPHGPLPGSHGALTMSAAARSRTSTCSTRAPLIKEPLVSRHVRLVHKSRKAQGGALPAATGPPLSNERCV